MLKSGCLYALKLNNVIIGLMHIFNCAEYTSPKTGEITTLYILQEYWRKGYGSLLIEYAIRIFRENGYSRIIIWVLAENERAINFYKKYGFSDDKMEKKLTLGTELAVKRFSVDI